MSVPLDDVYDAKECTDECHHCGDLTGCKPYAKWLTKCVEEGKPSDATIATSCDDFLSWRDIYGGAGYL